MKREQILRMLANMDAGAMKQANEILSLGEAAGVDVVTEPEVEALPHKYTACLCPCCGEVLVCQFTVTEVSIAFLNH